MQLNPLPRVHELVGDAPWGLPVIDAMAERVGRNPVPATRRRELPDRARPREDHLVSVVVPCYNYGRFLPAAVSSVLQQEDVAVEVVVVDDASTDNSAEVAQSLARHDGRVTVLQNPVNAGHVATFNRGLGHVRGEFVVRLDADDLLTPGSLSRAVSLFEAAPSVGLVYGHPRHFDSATPPPPRVGRPTWSTWRGREWIAERCRRGVNCITTPEAVLRTSVVEQVGPLDTTLGFAQDMEMWLRVASASDVGRVNDADQALHRDHPASMSVTTGAGVLLDLEERRRVFDRLFASPTGRALPGREDLHDAARRALGEEALGHVLYLRDRGRDDPALAEGLAAFLDETAPQLAGPGRPAEPVARPAIAAAAHRVPALARATRARLRSELDYLRWTRVGL